MDVNGIFLCAEIESTVGALFCTVFKTSLSLDEELELDADDDEFRRLACKTFLRARAAALTFCKRFWCFRACSSKSGRSCLLLSNALGKRCFWARERRVKVVSWLGSKGFGLVFQPAEASDQKPHLQAANKKNMHALPNHHGRQKLRQRMCFCMSCGYLFIFAPLAQIRWPHGSLTSLSVTTYCAQSVWQSDQIARFRSGIDRAIP